MSVMTERVGLAMAVLLRAAGVFVLVCAGLFLWQLRDATREVQRTVRDADTAVLETQKRLADTSQNLNAALIQVGLATDEARLASIEQRQYWSRISRETIGLIEDARTTVRQAGNDLDAVALDLHGVAGATVNSMNGVAPLLEQGSRTLATANAALADPNIARSLAGMAESTQHIAATAANVEKMSEDVQKKVHQMTQPKSFGKMLLGWVLDTAYKVKAFF